MKKKGHWGSEQIAQRFGVQESDVVKVYDYMRLLAEADKSLGATELAEETQWDTDLELGDDEEIYFEIAHVVLEDLDR